jgi:hypothetical protein
MLLLWLFRACRSMQQAKEEQAAATTEAAAAAEQADKGWQQRKHRLTSSREGWPSMQPAASATLRVMTVPAGSVLSRPSQLDQHMQQLEQSTAVAAAFRRHCTSYQPAAARGAAASGTCACLTAVNCCRSSWHFSNKCARHEQGMCMPTFPPNIDNACHASCFAMLGTS